MCAAFPEPTFICAVDVGDAVRIAVYEGIHGQSHWSEELRTKRRVARVRHAARETRMQCDFFQNLWLCSRCEHAARLDAEDELALVRRSGARRVTGSSKPRPKRVQSIARVPRLISLSKTITLRPRTSVLVRGT